MAASRSTGTRWRPKAGRRSRGTRTRRCTTGREEVQDLVGGGGDDVLLGQRLDGVGEGLGEAQRSLRQREPGQAAAVRPRRFWRRARSLRSAMRGEGEEQAEDGQDRRRSVIRLWTEPLPAGRGTGATIQSRSRSGARSRSFRGQGAASCCGSRKERGRALHRQAWGPPAAGLRRGRLRAGRGVGARGCGGSAASGGGSFGGSRRRFAFSSAALRSAVRRTSTSAASARDGSGGSSCWASASCSRLSSRPVEAVGRGDLEHLVHLDRVERDRPRRRAGSSCKRRCRWRRRRGRSAVCPWRRASCPCSSRCRCTAADTPSRRSGRRRSAACPSGLSHSR